MTGVYDSATMKVIEDALLAPQRHRVNVAMDLPKRELLALQVMPMLVQTNLFSKGYKNLTSEHYREIIKEALNIADIFLGELK